MSKDVTDLRARLRDADPAAGTAEYSPAMQRDMIARALATGQGLAAPTGGDRVSAGALAPVTGGAVLPRRVRIGLVGGGLALVAAGLGAVLVVPGDRAVPGDVTAQGGPVAVEMELLAAGVSEPLPADRYLFTQTRQLMIGGTAGLGVLGRRWETETHQRWQGDTCNDRERTEADPVRFFSDADEESLRQEVSAEDLKRVTNGWSQDSRGEDLRALDDVPCSKVGDFDHPNPKYAATYPSDAEGFLAKATRDSAHVRGEISVAEAVLQLLALPYLTAEQRSAALNAFGEAAGEWTAHGSTTVAGIEGIVVRRDLGPIEEERVIGGQAPGVLRTTLRITDPGRAAEFDPRFDGLAEGTVVREEALQRVAVVPDLDTLP